MPGSVGDSGNFCHCLHLGLSCRAQLVLLTFFFLQVVVTHRTQCLIRFASRVPKTRPNNSHSTLRVAGIPGQQPGASHLPYAAMGNKSRFKYCQYRGACTPSRKLVGMPGTQPVDGSELGPFTTDAVAASALDKVLGVKSTDLARGHQSAVPRSASNFKYVTSKVRRDGTQHWVAQPTACRVAAPGRHSTRCGPVGCLLQVTIDRRPKTWHILSVQLQVRGRLSRSTV